MTTGNTTFSSVVKTVDGWPFYNYGRKSWSGGDTPSAQRTKTKVFRTYRLKTYEIINGRKVLVVKDVLRSRLVPARARRLSPNSYTVNGFSMVQDDFKFGVLDSGTWNGGLINEPPFPTYWTEVDDTKLFALLRDRIAGSTFNAAVTTAEGAKTLKMITETATRIRKFYSNFRKGNFYRAADELFAGRKLKKPNKRVSSQFLEMKYGWLPLLQDVNEGAAFLATNYNSPRIMRIEATRSAGGQRERNVDYPYWGLPFNLGNIDMNCSHQESKRIICLLTEVDVPTLSGLHDPASVVWELVPYSFVVDWFIPIGSWLQARALPQALSGTFITNYRRRAKMNFLWIHQTSGSTTSPMVWKKRADAGTYEQYHFSRSVSSTLPYPPAPKIKALNESMSWVKAVTSLALLNNIRR